MKVDATVSKDITILCNSQQRVKQKIMAACTSYHMQQKLYYTSLQHMLHKYHKIKVHMHMCNQLFYSINFYNYVCNSTFLMCHSRGKRNKTYCEVVLAMRADGIHCVKEFSTSTTPSTTYENINFIIIIIIIVKSLNNLPFR